MWYRISFRVVPHGDATGRAGVVRHTSASRQQHIIRCCIGKLWPCVVPDPNYDYTAHVVAYPLRIADHPRRLHPAAQSTCYTWRESLKETVVAPGSRPARLVPGRVVSSYVRRRRDANKSCRVRRVCLSGYARSDLTVRDCWRDVVMRRRSWRSTSPSSARTSIAALSLSLSLCLISFSSAPQPATVSFLYMP